MRIYNADKQSVALRRAGGHQWVLKPQDFAVALKLVVLKGRSMPYQALAKILRLSQFEAHAAVQRLIAARLVVELQPFAQPVMAALRNFAVHGAPYCYPAVRGEVTIGFPTSHSMAPFRTKFIASKEANYVWPHPEGTARGTALLPLYKDLPLAAAEDSQFYELLAVFDALRVGQAREREFAMDFLKDALK